MGLAHGRPPNHPKYTITCRLVIVYQNGVGEDLYLKRPGVLRDSNVAGAFFARGVIFFQEPQRLPENSSKKIYLKMVSKLVKKKCLIDLKA